MHYGFKTRYSIVKDEKIFSFMSLSPRHIYEDQLKMKKKKVKLKVQNNYVRMWGRVKIMGILRENISPEWRKIGFWSRDERRKGEEKKYEKNKETS